MTPAERFAAGLCVDCPGARRPKSPRCDACRLVHRRLVGRDRARQARQRPEFREQQREASRRYREANPEKVKATLRRGHERHYRRRTYGLTCAEFAAMAMEQGLACAICGRIGELHVDHDHATGRVRALLCGRCNKGLGLFGESPEALSAAIEYLARHRAEAAS